MTTFSPTPIEIPDLPPAQFPWESPQPDMPQEPMKVLPVIVHGATYVWDDVYQWGKSTLENLLGFGGQAASVTFQDVQNIVEVAMSVQQTIVANFVAQLENWVNDGVAHLQEAIVGLGQYTLTELLKVYDSLIGLSQAMVSALQQEVAALQQQIAQVEQNLTNILEMTVSNLENWVRTDIALPIMQALQELDLKTQMEMQSILAQAETYADGLLNAKLATLLPAIAALQQAVQKLQTESDECTQPMCDTMGPKTDLGKALKALEGLLGVLAGFAVAGLTEADLERLANMLATGITTPAEDLLSGFVARGETVGHAASAVIADIGNVGDDLLHELGAVF